MKRRFALLSVLFACAAGCEQVLGLDEYQPAGDDAGSDATQMPSPEGAPDTGAVDRATGTEAGGADVTSGPEGSEGAVELDSAAADVTSASDSSDAANGHDAAPDDADAFAAPDSEDASAPDAADATTSDAMSMTDAPAEATDSATEPTDSATVNTCPQRTPPGATLCCGHSACVSRQGNACNCGECNSNHCAGFCCFDSNGAFSCVASPADCH
jgi:hypothetical protein